jgi:polyhydroxyalkanoate synthesis regulator phasin
MYIGVYSTVSFEDDLVKFKEKLKQGQVFDNGEILYFVDECDTHYLERIDELNESVDNLEDIVSTLEEDIVTCVKERNEAVKELQDTIDDLLEQISDLNGQLLEGCEYE